MSNKPLVPGAPLACATTHGIDGSHHDLSSGARVVAETSDPAYRPKATPKYGPGQ